MRDALPELGVEGRIGVMTGEVVTGTEERLATGDAVNVAARLQQAAQPGEVLIGEPVLALVRDAVEVEPIEPLVLKGKSRAGRGLPVDRGARSGRTAHDSRFVGRQDRLALIQAAWDRVRREAALRVGHDRRRGGRRQVAPRRQGARADRWPRRPGPLSALRGGNHLLAGGRGGQAARRLAVRPGGWSRDPLAAR